VFRQNNPTHHESHPHIIRDLAPTSARHPQVVTHRGPRFSRRRFVGRQGGGAFSTLTGFWHRHLVSSFATTSTLCRGKRGQDCRNSLRPCYPHFPAWSLWWRLRRGRQPAQLFHLAEAQRKAPDVGEEYSKPRTNRFLGLVMSSRSRHYADLLLGDDNQVGGLFGCCARTGNATPLAKGKATRLETTHKLILTVVVYVNLISGAARLQS
jgi:hypothetical protein